MATELTPVEQVKEKILKLQQMVTDKNPSLPHQLRDVHNFLQAQPECVTLFRTEPEMAAVLVQALERQTNTELVAKPAKAPSKTAALKKSSLADLGF